MKWKKYFYYCFFFFTIYQIKIISFFQVFLWLGLYFFVISGWSRLRIEVNYAAFISLNGQQYIATSASRRLSRAASLHTCWNWPIAASLHTGWNGPTASLWRSGLTFHLNDRSHQREPGSINLFFYKYYIYLSIYFQIFTGCSYTTPVPNMRSHSMIVRLNKLDVQLMTPKLIDIILIPYLANLCQLLPSWYFHF